MSKLTSAATILTKLAQREYRYYKLIPTNLLVFMTYRCTSRCKTCTMWKRKASRYSELSLPELKCFIDMCSEWPIRHVEIFGGDALLRKDDTLELARYIKSKGIQADLATNCHLLDKETAERIVDAGFGNVYVSLDGLQKQHDEIRGVDGSFERVSDAIDSLRQARRGCDSPKIFVQCTVSRFNAGHLDKVLEYAEEKGADVVAFEYVGEFPLEAVRRSGVNGTVPDPYYVPQNNSTVRVDPQQVSLLKEQIARIKRRKKELRAQVITGNIDILSEEQLVSGVCPHKKCYVARYLVTLDPYGNLIPCPFFNNYYLGNVREAPMPQIWANERHLRFIRAISRGRVEMCKYCILSVERNQSIIGLIKKRFLQGRA